MYVRCRWIDLLCSCADVDIGFHVMMSVQEESKCDVNETMSVEIERTSVRENSDENMENIPKTKKQRPAKRCSVCNVSKIAQDVNKIAEDISEIVQDISKIAQDVSKIMLARRNLFCTL